MKLQTKIRWLLLYGPWCIIIAADMLSPHYVAWLRSYLNWIV